MKILNIRNIRKWNRPGSPPVPCNGLGMLGGGHYKRLTTAELTLGGKVVSLSLVSASDIVPKKHPLHQFLSL